LSTDNLPEAGDKKIPTLDELNRILSSVDYDRLVNNSYTTLTEVDQSYLKKDAPILDEIMASNQISQSISVVSGEIRQSLLPSGNNQVNLGSPSRAFGKIYAYQFIDVDGNSLIIKDKHFGYNGTEDLRFGDDKVILEPMLEERIENLRKDSADHKDVTSYEVSALTTSLQALNDKVTYSISQLKKSNVNIYAVIDEVKEGLLQSINRVSWDSLRGRSDNLKSIDRLTGLYGVYSSESHVPIDKCAPNSLVFVLNYKASGLPALAKVVVNPSNGERSLISGTDELRKVSHSDLLGLEEDSHPQYLKKQELLLEVRANAGAVKRSIGMGDSDKFFGGSDQLNLERAQRHLADTDNPHKLSPEKIGAIEDKEGVITKEHLSSVSTDDLLETGSKRFVTPEVAKAMADVAKDVDTLMELWDFKLWEQLAQAEDTQAHYHSEDRDLANATGVLSIDKVNLDALIQWVLSLPEVEEAINKSHSEHTLEGLRDLTSSADEVNSILEAHKGRGGILDAHNAGFAGHASSFGVSRKVARSDHDHDSRYFKKSDYLSPVQSEDAPGTIKEVDGTLKILTKNGWKKIVLED
jgi:hypothetical protein